MKENDILTLEFSTFGLKLLVCIHFTHKDPAAYCPGQTSQILRITRDPCLILFSFIFRFIFLPLRCGLSPLIL